MENKPETYSIFLTGKCNLKCLHCFWEDKKRNQSLTKEGLGKIIENLPNDHYFAIMFTGGEIMLEKDLLLYGLDKLKKIRRRKKSIFSVKIQTNGYWLKDNQKTYHLIKKIKKLGAGIEIASDDNFHREAGFDITKKKYIIDKAREIFPDIKVWGVINESLLYKRGRAVKNFPDAKESCQYPIRIPSMHEMMKYSDFSLLKPNFFIFPDGTLNICESGIPSPLGSAIDNKIEKLEKEMAEEHKAFIQEGIIGVLKYRKLFQEDKIKDYQKHPCSYCREIYQ